MLTTHRTRTFGIVAATVLVLSPAALVARPAMAQNVHHRTFAQKHPTLTGAAAGFAAARITMAASSSVSRIGGYVAINAGVNGAAGAVAGGGAFFSLVLLLLQAAMIKATIPITRSFFINAVFIF